MARNRIIYGSEAVIASQFATSTGTGAHAQLRRVQSFGHTEEVASENIQQFGNTARIGTIVLSSPTVTEDVTYLLGDGYNENVLGFYVQSATARTAEAGFASGHMVTSSGINVYELITPEGTDANTLSGPASLSGYAVNGFGNSFLSNWSLNAAVGGFPTVTVSLESLNANHETYVCNGAITGVNTPAIDATAGTALAQNTGVRLPIPVVGTGAGIPLALRPGDITLNFGSLTGTGATTLSPFYKLDGADGLHIQSVDIAVPLSRTPIERLGSRFAYARTLDLPIDVTMSVSAIVNEQVKRNLASALDDTTEHTVTTTINQPDGTPACKFTLKGARFNSQASSLDIGGNKTVDLQFTAQIGSINDTARGLFMSGAYDGSVFQ